MSDTDPYAESGVPVHETFVPMAEAEKPREKTYNGVDAVKEAAADLVKERGQESDPIEVAYLKQSGDHAGEKMPAHETVSLEKAAEDLTNWRDGIVHEREQQSNQLTAEVIDNLRANRLNPDLQPQTPEAQQPDQTQQAQPEITPQPETPEAQAPDGVDPEIAEALQKSPKLRAALEAEVTKVQQAQQSYINGLQQNAQVALMALLSDEPALKGMNSDQLQGALSQLSHSDPARYVALKARLDNVGALWDQSQQVQRQLQERADQHYKAEFAKFAVEQDKLLETMMPEMKDPAVARKVGEAAINTLRSSGISDQDLGKLLRGEATFSIRDARVQSLLIKAAKYDEAVAAQQQARQRPIPNVQRPGISTDRNSGEDSNIASLRQRAKATGSLRDAAALLTAERNSRR
jgi:hypothetical protein